MTGDSKETMAMATRRPTRRWTRAGLVVAVAAAGLAVASTASAAPVTINLCAVPGTATLVGAVTVPVWGFGIPGTPGDCTTATAGLPGPTIIVAEGDTVTLTVVNALPPGAGHTVRFEVPGIAFDPGPTDAAPGASVTRTFTATAPGTYLYSSGGGDGRQRAMGLAGPLVVRSATPGQAYDTATSAYTVEAQLVLGAVDPAFNAAPDTFDLHGYRATYWLINGKSYPDTAPILAGGGQRVLLRYLNAGYDNTSMALLGMHETVLARDARLLANPIGVDAETIPAGATEDAIVVVPSGAPPGPNGFGLYNRQLHLTNGPQTTAGPTPLTGGGMLTFIRP
jgi:FtsP/CotA-like multicopper oxidase with cupredoxin domain